MTTAIWRRDWIKLWGTILDDPKMGRLTEHLWKRAVELFILAGVNSTMDATGELPSVDDMAWRLHTEPEGLEQDLNELRKVKIVGILPGARWQVLNFQKWQIGESTLRMRGARQGTQSAEQSAEQSAGESAGVVPALSSISISISNSLSKSLSVFTSSFGTFNGDREKKRWIALVESVGLDQAKQIAVWAEKKEVHMTNRGGLLDSMETAAKNWKEKGGKKKTGEHILGGKQVEAAVERFTGG